MSRAVFKVKVQPEYGHRPYTAENKSTGVDMGADMDKAAEPSVEGGRSRNNHFLHTKKTTTCCQALNNNFEPYRKLALPSRKNNYSKPCGKLK
jgi:hypothetical protein